MDDKLDGFEGLLSRAMNGVTNFRRQRKTEKINERLYEGSISSLKNDFKIWNKTENLQSRVNKLRSDVGSVVSNQKRKMDESKSENLESMVNNFRKDEKMLYVVETNLRLLLSMFGG